MTPLSSRPGPAGLRVESLAVTIYVQPSHDLAAVVAAAMQQGLAADFRFVDDRHVRLVAYTLEGAQMLLHLLARFGVTIAPDPHTPPAQPTEDPDEG